jgi:hypothetical protein
MLKPLINMRLAVFSILIPENIQQSADKSIKINYYLLTVKLHLALGFHYMEEPTPA